MTKLEEQLIRDEGEVLHAYQDHLGYWTIGVGHLIDKRRGGGISKSISRTLLKVDIQDKYDELYTAAPWVTQLDRVRHAALVNMAFQLGVGGLLKFTKMLIYLRHGEWDKAYEEALDSKWSEQTPERAKRVAKQLLTGEWQ